MTKDHGQGNKRAHEEVNPDQQIETGSKKVKKQDLPETEELTPVKFLDTILRLIIMIMTIVLLGMIVRDLLDKNPKVPVIKVWMAITAGNETVMLYDCL